MPGFDIIGRLDGDTAVLRARLLSLTRQQATGLKSERPADLGAQLPRALSLRAEIGRRDTYGTLIGQQRSSERGWPRKEEREDERKNCREKIMNRIG